MLLNEHGGGCDCCNNGDEDAFCQTPSHLKHSKLSIFCLYRVIVEFSYFILDLLINRY